MISFDQPLFLLGLWLAPVGFAMLLYMQWRSRRRVLRFVRWEMVERLVPIMSAFAGGLKAVLISLALGLMIFSLAGPQYGIYFEEIERRGADIYILLDVSRSMLVEDLKPNRLERAKSDIHDFIDEAAGDRIGLIVFAGEPRIKVPLTTDYEFYREVLEKTNVNSAPSGGTAFGSAILSAVRAMPRDSAREQVIILITDGEDHESLPLLAAEEAAHVKIKVFTVGIGDASEGGRIPFSDEKGRKSFQKYEGEEIWSRAHGEILEKIANITGGKYIPVGTRSYDFKLIYANYLSDLDRGLTGSQKQKRLHPQYQGFLLFGIVLLLCEPLIRETRPRKRSFANI